MADAGLYRRPARAFRFRPVGSRQGLGTSPGFLWVLGAAAFLCVPGSLVFGLGHAAPGHPVPALPAAVGLRTLSAATHPGCPAQGGPNCGEGRVPSPAPANLNWSNLSASLGGAPEPRAYAASAFDAKIEGVVLFGGQGPGGTALGDTWEFVAGGWEREQFDGAAPAPRWGATAVYDSVDGYTVLFGGTNGSGFLSDSWLFNRSGWHALASADAPPARAYATASYDPALGSVVLFGGEGAAATPLNDTWTFRAGVWTDSSAAFAPAPPARALAASGYDPSDGYLVLFGGSAGIGSADVLGDVWRLDPSGWHNLTSPDAGASGPAPRAGAAFAQDPSLGELVLFGGSGRPDTLEPDLSLAWVFASGGWSGAVGGSTPGPSAREGLSFDGDAFAGFSLLFGGTSAAVPRGDTWSFGTSVLQISVTVVPTAGAAPLNSTFSVTASGGVPPYTVDWSFGDRMGGSALSNATHVYGLPGNYTAVVTVTDSGGDSASHGTPIAVLTSWQGGHQWAQLGSPGRPVPSPRASSQVAYDPSIKAVVLFGGEGPGGAPLGDTWEFVNNVWIDLSSGLSSAPPARWGGSLAYDPVDAALVLFGGTDGTGYNGDTWTFNGSGWYHASTVGPSPRAFAQMAFDALDGYVVLFGGAQGSAAGTGWTVDSDTWEYRGGVWQNITTQLPIAPPPTAGGSATYDSADQALLLFGGSSIAPNGAPGTCYPNGATWTFAGGSWTSVAATTVPAGQMLPMEAFDAVDHLVLVFGGAQSVGGVCQVTAGTWSYVGGGWSNLTGPASASPAGRDAGAVTFDGAEGVVLLFGGNSMGLMLNDTWLYPAPLNTSATSETGNSTSSSPGGLNGSGGNGTDPNGSGPNGTPGSGSGAGGLPFNVGYTVSPTGSSGPMTVAFVATAVGGTAPFTFSWYFGDSSPSIVASHISHRYTVPGSYNPVLTATDASGETLVRVLATIQVAPSVSAGTTTGPDVALTGPTALQITEAFLGTGAAVVIALVVVFRRQERRQEEGEFVGDNA
ncbi:MAG TPA: kelch repeat-containing protein [Thermoplasmata archaeon]